MGQSADRRLSRLRRHRGRGLDCGRRSGSGDGSDRITRIKEIVTLDGPLARAETGDAVTLTVTDEIDLSRGDLLVDPARAPNMPTSLPRI